MRTDTELATFEVPVTPMQEALWWVHQRAQNKSVYNISWRLTADRPVDLAALGVAWQAIVDRHEALRTSVVRPGDQVQMVVHPRVRARLRLVELAEPAGVPVDTLLRLLAEELHEQEIDLAGESLARLTALRVGDRHELLLTVHHVMIDGWALQLVMAELSTAYAAACAGEPPSFAAEPVPFRVYAAEQNAGDPADRWRASLDHWRSTLDGARASTVAAAVDAEFVPGAPGEVLRHTFSPAAAAAIGALAERTYALPFAIFQAATHIVLARGGAGPDVAIGAVVANRMSPRDQALVGYTANLCISRAQVRDTDRLVDVVTRARDSVWSTLMHQAVPYNRVLTTLSGPTRRGLTEDLPVGVSHLGPIGSGLRLGDVGLTLQPSPNRAARADISISTWEDGGYHAEIEYNTSRYTRATIDTLRSDVDTVLALCGSEPDRLVGTVEVGSRAVVAYLDHARVDSSPAAQTLPESAEWQQVTKLWSAHLGGPPAGPDVDFFAAGGTSLGLLRLTSELEAATGVLIDAVEWLSEPTPRRLVAALAGDGTAGTGPVSTLLTLREGGGGPHVHLLPGAGGGPTDFRDVVAALPEHWRVTASRELEPLASVPALAERYRADLAAAGLRPDLLCGWSMGGLVAYAMAAADPAPPPLVLLDAPPPLGWPPEPEEELFRGFAGAFLGSAVDGAAGGPTTLPRTDGDGELRIRVLAACLAAGGEAVPAAALADRWASYARHARMGEAYVGPGRVPVPALVVAAELRDVDVHAWVDRLGVTRQRRVAADHYGMLRADVAAQLAAEIVEFEKTE